MLKRGDDTWPGPTVLQRSPFWTIKTLSDLEDGVLKASLLSVAYFGIECKAFALLPLQPF